jgi:hypothetical protein
MSIKCVKGALGKAQRILQGESPCRVRFARANVDGCLMGHSSQGLGKPATRRRTPREYVAFKNNSCRTSRAGYTRGNRHEGNSQLSHVTGNCVMVRAKASTTEEPDAGKLHVRVCGGGVG